MPSPQTPHTIESKRLDDETVPDAHNEADAADLAEMEAVDDIAMAQEASRVQMEDDGEDGDRCNIAARYSPERVDDRLGLSWNSFPRAGCIC